MYIKWLQSVQRMKNWVKTEGIQQNCEVMKNSAPAWESRVWQSTSSDEKHKTLSKVDKSIFLWSYLYTNRSDWMAACINHMYCIGITLSTSPQKVFCHRLGNLKLYPSGKVGPRKVFNNPRKLFERYRWMEKSFGLSDEIVHTPKSTTTMAHLNSPLFLGQMMTFVCICAHNPWIMKTLFWALLRRPNTKLKR